MKKKIIINIICMFIILELLFLLINVILCQMFDDYSSFWEKFVYYQVAVVGVIIGYIIAVISAYNTQELKQLDTLIKIMEEYKEYKKEEEQKSNEN